MRSLVLAILTVGLISLSGAGDAWGQGREPIRLANDAAVSPDGSSVVFSWAGDLWTVPVQGGKARALTRSPANDRHPAYSPDGKSIAFVSDRLGSVQPFVMPAEGGAPRQVGFHTAGYLVEGWAPDGQSLLVSGSRDHFWRDADRFFLLKIDQRTAEVPLFDSPGRNGRLSPDGRKLLFTREGAPWWRKGYWGSQDSQVWLYDIGSQSFTKVLNPPGGALWPLWKPDGKGFYYVGIHKGALNLREHDLETGKDRPMTEFDDDSVVFPAISRDGSTIVFRNLFDLYRLHPAKGGPPERIEVWNEGDPARERVERRTLTQATQAVFSRDGLEVAFIAGGDLWVMDTELKEPRQVTSTPEEERDPAFSPSEDAIYFVSDKADHPDIWKAVKGNASADWWQNTTFKVDRVTDDKENETALRFSPDGSHLAFVKSRGDLWVMKADGKDARRLLAGFNRPEFDWSPDGAWLVTSQEDDDFNNDVWILPLDGSRPPFNVSRHPHDEGDPAWSPDGRMIAFTGHRHENQVDVFYVFLRADDDQKSSRERTMEKAVDKIRAARKKAATKGAADAPATKERTRNGGDAEKKPPAKVEIDFEGLHDRIRRISIPDSVESNVFWSPDSKKLAFTATIDGKNGVYTVEPPDDLKPKLLSSDVGSHPQWLDAGQQIVSLVGGVPASFSPSGKSGTYNFRALQEVDLSAKYRAAFELSWRIMRDQWYDEKLGNRDWDAIRRKYADAAAAAPDPEALGIVVNLMLGELNGSHLGFTPGGGGRATRPGRTPTAPTEAGGRWSESTAHLGLRFHTGHKGPGLKVRDVIPNSPADHKTSKVEPGELVLAIDGTAVDPATDLTRVLNGPPDRDIRLKVQAADGKTREVVLRPIAYGALSGLLYDKWVKDNRAKVESLSKGTLGYLHIRGMDFVSFERFQEDLYAAGAGKSGLVIDVRENGGGSTADHLLTALTQPVHATTVPRGGGPGYPQDRRVYATWSKPIVVLCNQNSFSNAEIFSHAIKTLKRGALVGVPTAGGVLSTGAAGVMDVGMIRLPARGWYILGTGEDMELNGAVPDHVLWPEPADFARGVDAQLMKGVQVLLTEVVEVEQKPKPKFRKATERENPLKKP